MSDSLQPANAKIRVNQRQRYSTIARPPELQSRLRRDSTLSLVPPDEIKGKSSSLFDKIKKKTQKKSDPPRERNVSESSHQSSTGDATETADSFMTTAPTTAAFNALDLLGEGLPNTNYEFTEAALPEPNILPQQRPGDNTAISEFKKPKSALDAINEDLNKYKAIPTKTDRKKVKSGDGSSKFPFLKSRNRTFSGTPGGDIPEAPHKDPNANEVDMNLKIKSALSLNDIFSKAPPTLSTDEGPQQSLGENGTTADTDAKKLKSALGTISENVDTYKPEKTTTKTEKKKKAGDGSSKFSFRKRQGSAPAALDVFSDDEADTRAEDALASPRLRQKVKPQISTSLTSETSPPKLPTISAETNKTKQVDKTKAAQRSAKPTGKSIFSTAASNIAENKLDEEKKELDAARVMIPQAPSYLSFRNVYLKRKNEVQSKRDTNTTMSRNIISNTTYTSSYHKWKSCSTPRIFGSPYEATFPQLISDSSDSSDEEGNNMINMPHHLVTREIANKAQCTEKAGDVFTTNNSQTPFVAKISYYDSSDSEDSDSGVELPNKTCHFVAIITAKSESESDDESDEVEPFDKSKIPAKVNKINGLFIQTNTSSNVAIRLTGTARRPFPCYKDWKLSKLTNRTDNLRASDDSIKSSKESERLLANTAKETVEKNSKSKLKLYSPIKSKSVTGDTLTKPSDKSAKPGKKLNNDPGIPSMPSQRPDKMNGSSIQQRANTMTNIDYIPERSNIDKATKV